jgi:hypothetical protein
LLAASESKRNPQITPRAAARSFFIVQLNIAASGYCHDACQMFVDLALIAALWSLNSRLASTKFSGCF